MTAPFLLPEAEVFPQEDKRNSRTHQQHLDDGTEGFKLADKAFLTHVVEDRHFWIKLKGDKTAHSIFTRTYYSSNYESHPNLPCDDIVLQHGLGHPSASGNAFLLVLLVLKHEMEKRKDIRYRIFLSDFPDFGESKIDPIHPLTDKEVGAKSGQLNDWDAYNFGAILVHILVAAGFLARHETAIGRLHNHVPSLLSHSFGSMCAGYSLSMMPCGIFEDIVLLAFIHEGNAAIDHFQDLTSLQRTAIQRPKLQPLLVATAGVIDRVTTPKGRPVQAGAHTSSNQGVHPNHLYTGLAPKESQARMAVAIQGHALVDGSMKHIAHSVSRRMHCMWGLNDEIIPSCPEQNRRQPPKYTTTMQGSYQKLHSYNPLVTADQNIPDVKHRFYNGLMRPQGKKPAQITPATAIRFAVWLRLYKLGQTGLRDMPKMPAFHKINPEAEEYAQERLLVKQVWTAEQLAGSSAEE